MNKFELLEMPFEVPEDCLNCPGICTIAKTILQERAKKQRETLFATTVLMDQDATEGAVDLVAGLTGQSREEAEELVRAQNAMLRDHMADRLDEGDTRIEELTCGANALMDSCAGTLTLAGTTLLNREVEVVVCGSNIAPLDPFSAEHTHIARDGEVMPH